MFVLNELCRNSFVQCGICTFSCNVKGALFALFSFPSLWKQKKKTKLSNFTSSSYTLGNTTKLVSVCKRWGNRLKWAEQRIKMITVRGFFVLRICLLMAHTLVFFSFLSHSSKTFSLTPLTALVRVCVTLPGFEDSHWTEFSICWSVGYLYNSCVQKLKAMVEVNGRVHVIGRLQGKRWKKDSKRNGGI